MLQLAIAEPITAIRTNSRKETLPQILKFKGVRAEARRTSCGQRNPQGRHRSLPASISEATVCPNSRELRLPTTAAEPTTRQRRVIHFFL